MGLTGTNQEVGRPYNRRLVLETIRVKGPLSRADVARAVLLTPQTVSNIVAELEQAGLVTGIRQRARRRGQPSTQYSILPDAAYAIGLELQPTRLKAVLVDLAGRSRGHRSWNLPSADPDRVFPIMQRLVAKMTGLKPAAKILGIGIAMPGPFGVEGISFVGPTTMTGWADVPIAARLEALTGLPVFVGMDTTAAAVCERLYGHGRELRQFFHIYFGLGTGGSISQDGHTLGGAFGNAGELGHFPLMPDGEPCPCGNRGCLERTVSLEALGRRFRAAGIPLRAAALEAPKGRAAAVVDRWIADAAPQLARAIVMVENLLDPEAVILGGLLPDRLVDRLIAAMEPLPNSISSRRQRPVARVLRSTLGAEVAQIGAATLAIAGVMSPRYGLLFLSEDSANPPPDPILTRRRGPVPRARGQAREASLA